MEEPVHILIAEDEELNFNFLKTLITRLLDINCTILHAKNGLLAVELFRENPSINLILMDIKMPEMNGFEATATIRKENTSIPIIAQTAFATKEDKIKAITSGCNDFIAKPIDRKEMIDLLHRYIRKN